VIRIGIDLGGTKTEAVALAQDGREIMRLRVATPRGNYDATIESICALVREVETRSGGGRGTVGVGIPGTITRATGLVKNANSTWLNGRPLARDLSSALGREVRCVNDANCFAISEATDGAGQGEAVVFGVILGTGCGGGLVVDGKVHAGVNGLAGEWGHTPLPWPSAQEVPGLACYCGRSGCLETWISGTGFERDFEREAGLSLAGREIVRRGRDGDLLAMAAYRRLQDRIARGLAVIVNILDPDVIVLGGGLSNIDELYTGELENQIAQYTFGGKTTTPVRRNRHGDSSGVRGAAWLWSIKDENAR
jgi:fructokinase